MNNKNFAWLETARDRELECANIFTGRAIEIVLLAFLVPWLWFGLMSLTELVKALFKLSSTPIAGPLIYLVVFFLLLLFGRTRKEFAESVGLAYGLFEKTMRLISSVVVGALEVSARRPLTARLTALVMLIVLMTLGFVLCCHVFLPRNILATSLSWPAPSREAWLQRLGDIYTVALLGCFSAFAIENTISDKWWLTFFRVAIETDFETVPESHEEKDVGALALAHVSDLHAHVQGGHLIEDPKRRVSAATIEAVLSSIARDCNIEVVVCSGDSTDDGSVESWTQLLSLPSWDLAKDKLILAPGNHDLNYLETGARKSLLRIEKRTEQGMHLRALRYLKVADLVMGERAKLISPFTGGVTTLREAMERMEPDFKLWAAKQKLAGNAILPLSFLGKSFPMVVTTELTENKCAFLVWNTVKKNSVPIWNSVGEIASDQIDRARELMRHIPPSLPIIHVMHHQVTLPRAKTFRMALKRVLGIGMVLNYSQRFFDWVAELRQSTVLLHGHHHKAFWCINADRNVGIVSAPSGTLGCEESFFDQLPSETKEPHWLRVKIALKGANARVTRVVPVRVLSSEEIEVRNEEGQALDS